MTQYDTVLYHFCPNYEIYLRHQVLHTFLCPSKETVDLKEHKKQYTRTLQDIPITHSSTNPWKAQQNWGRVKVRGCKI